MLIPISYFVPNGTRISSIQTHGTRLSCSTITSERHGGFKMATMLGTAVSHLGVRGSYKPVPNFLLKTSTLRTSCFVGHIATYLNQKESDLHQRIWLHDFQLRVIRNTDENGLINSGFTILR